MNATAREIKKLTGLTSALFQHPSDRAVLAKLEAVPVIPGMIGAIMDTVKLQMEMELLANSFHVTAESFPKLNAIYQKVCATLCVESPPELYVEYSPGYNAYTTGVDKAIVVVSSAMAADFNDQELTYVLGHELGHYLSGHIKYKMLVRLITGGATMLLGGLAKIAANATFGPLLFLWSRRSEYTSDRAGLLACQDIAGAHRANLRLAGCPPRFIDSLPPDILLKQVEMFDRRVSDSLLGNMFAGLNQLYSTHPRLIERSAELKNWIDEGWFEDIVNGSESTRRNLAGQLATDPVMAEMNMLLVQHIARHAAGEFNVPRSEAMRLVRRAIFGGEPLRHTALERILRIELAVTRDRSDKVKYTVGILVNHNGRPVVQQLGLPLPESWDDTPMKIRKDFLTQNTNTIVNVLYSVDTEPSPSHQ